MAEMKEQTKAPKIKLSDEEIANLLDAEFKTLVIRMLRELTEYNKYIREEMKATWREIKKNPGNQQWREEAEVQINNLEHRKK